MVMTTKERTELRNELVSQGYAWEYVDEWQPKTTLYLHRARTNPEGDVVKPVGTKISGVPGNPDYVARKARIGMLPYPPSDTCECKWCAVGNVNKDKVTDSGEKVDEMPESATCSECGKVERALTSQAAQMKIRVHLKTHSA
jgi:hypothetical protein